MLERVFLGKVDYYQEEVEAYREVYPEAWKFVVVHSDGSREEVISY